MREKVEHAWEPVMNKLICAAMIWIVTLLSAMAQDQPKPQIEPFRGTWMATVGPNRFLRGFWSGELAPDNHDAARGTWTLLGDRGQVLLTGDWSARKSAQEWSGTWNAHVSHGKPVSGSWATTMEDASAKTFEDLLKKTLQTVVGGSWQSGKMKGNWQLQGSR